LLDLFPRWNWSSRDFHDFLGRLSGFHHGVYLAGLVERQVRLCRFRFIGQRWRADRHCPLFQGGQSVQDRLQYIRVTWRNAVLRLQYVAQHIGQYTVSG
jgi:hypothetical protein